DGDRIQAEGQGLKGQNYDRAVVRTTALMIDGTVYYLMAPFKVGEVVTNICVYVQVGGATMTLSKVGLYDLAMARLALSADQTTSWQTAGKKEIALTSAYTVTADGALYMAIVAKGATLPT